MVMENIVIQILRNDVQCREIISYIINNRVYFVLFEPSSSFLALFINISNINKAGLLFTITEK